MGQVFLQGKKGGGIQAAAGSFTLPANTYSWTLPLSEVGFKPNCFLLFATETNPGSSAEIMCLIHHPQIGGTYIMSARLTTWSRYFIDVPNYFRIEGQAVILSSTTQFGLLKANVLYRWVAARV